MREARPRLALFLHVIGPYFDHLRRGIADYHRRHGEWEFLHETIHVEEGNLSRLSEADGAIIALSNRTPSAEKALSRELVEFGKPVVEVSPARGESPFVQVHVDDLAVGQSAAGYLMSLGFENFGFVGVPLPFSQRREQGFRDTLALQGLGLSSAPIIERWWDPAASTEARQPWLRSLAKPAAILAASDMIAAVTLAMAQTQGILVPEQLALMGVDNGGLCDLYRPSLTSIPLDGAHAGYEAARLIDGMMQGKAAPVDAVPIPPLPIIARGSTDTLAINDSDIIAAVRYIRDHSSKPLSASHVVRQSAISRRKLEQRFQSVLHHTIGDEIRRAQTRRAMELLDWTPLTMEDVAAKSGFGSAAAFSRIFKRVIGCSPTTYRQRSLIQRNAR